MREKNPGGVNSLLLNKHMVVLNITIGNIVVLHERGLTFSVTQIN